MKRAFLTPITGGGNPPFIDPITLSWEVLLDSRNILPLANGTPIPLWPDTSSNGRDANPVPGFNPLYRPVSSPSGRPMADFGAVANSQMFGTLPVGGVGAALGFSFYAYYILDTVAKAGAGDSQIIFGDDVVNGFRLFGSLFQAAGDARPAFTTGAGTVLPAISVQATAAQAVILSCVCPPPSGVESAALWQEKSPIASGVWAANPQTQYLVSGNAAQNVWIRGRLAFAGFGKRVDSDFIRQGVVNFLRFTFG